MNILNRLLFKKAIKEQECILKQESDTSRIVQRRSPIGLNRFVIARERLVDDSWEIVDYLYTHQCKTLQEYINHFDYTDQRIDRKIGKEKQFIC